MNAKSIKKMSESGCIETLNEILDGLKEAANNFEEDSARYLLTELVEKVLNPLDGEDFFGTEGWEHYFGMED
jgi:hypothetical protein